MLHFSPRLGRWRMLFDNLIPETALLELTGATAQARPASARVNAGRGRVSVSEAPGWIPLLGGEGQGEGGLSALSLCVRLNAEPTNNALCTPLHPSAAQTKPAAKHPSGPILLNPTSKFAKTFLLIAASDSRSVSPFSLLIFNLVPHDSRRFA